MATPAAPAAPAAPADLSPRRVTAIVAVLALAVFMSSLDLFIVNLAFPYIGRDFHGTSLSSLSWVLNGYTIVFAAVLVPAGRWADRIGRRRVLLAGLVAFTAGSLLCGLAPGVGVLVGARIVQAVGAGMMVPASLSLLLAVRLVPESKDAHDAGRPDLAGAALLAASVGLVALALVKAPAWGWGSASFLGLLLAAVACGAAMVARSHRHHSPVIELSLLRSRTFSGAFAASVFYYAGFGAFVLNSVEFLTGQWHYSAVRAGLAIGPGPLMVVPFARLVAPRLAARLGGAGRVAVIGCTVNAAAQLLLYTLLTAHPAYATHMLPAQLLGGAGVGLSIPSLLGAGSASLTPDRFGTGSGILNMARQVGTVLGVAGLIAILLHVSPADPLAAYRHGIELIGAFFAAAGVVAAVLLTGRPVLAPARATQPATHPAAAPAGPGGSRA